MRQRQINTNFLRDEWVQTLVPDQKFFFSYFLTSPDIGLLGIGAIPEKIMAADLGYDLEVIRSLKNMMEKSGKMLFKGNWVCLVNFSKHNPMIESEKVLEGGSKQLSSLPHEVYVYFNTKLKELGAPMSLDDYMEKRRRNQVKKEIRKHKKWLMGPALEEEVDKVMGLADSGKMDWATIVESGKPASQYQTPDSVLPHLDEVAKQFSLRVWVLYWFFKRKVLKLEASGRTKSDYMAVLKECATKTKKMSNAEKVQALVLYSEEIRHEIMTPADAEIIIETNDL